MRGLTAAHTKDLMSMVGQGSGKAHASLFARSSPHSWPPFPYPKVECFCILAMLGFIRAMREASPAHENTGNGANVFLFRQVVFLHAFQKVHGMQGHKALVTGDQLSPWVQML